ATDVEQFACAKWYRQAPYHLACRQICACTHRSLIQSPVLRGHLLVQVGHHVAAPGLLYPVDVAQIPVLVEQRLAEGAGAVFEQPGPRRATKLIAPCANAQITSAD